MFSGFIVALTFKTAPAELRWVYSVGGGCGVWCDTPALDLAAPCVHVLHAAALIAGRVMCVVCML